MNSTARSFDFFQDIVERMPFQIRKERFLSALKSSTGKYKRYTGSPLRYAGGKTLAVGYIVELLPDKIERIISPFLGGASFEIACARELAIEVIGFDVFDLLVNYWQCQFLESDRVCRYLKKYAPTREGFNEVKARLKAHWTGETIIRNKTELAALYYYNHNTSYGPGFLSWPSSVYMNEIRYKKMIDKVRNTNLENIKVETASFEYPFSQYKDDFFYCDPPYYLDGNSKLFAGLYPQRNFPIHHKGFKHEKLRDLLLRHNGNFILSYNDCDTIREWYKDFEIIDVSWQYTMGQGETRIGYNRINGNNSYVKKSHELLIVKR